MTTDEWYIYLAREAFAQYVYQLSIRKIEIQERNWEELSEEKKAAWIETIKDATSLVQKNN